MVHELQVWLCARRAGSLALADGRLRFGYAPEWLSQPGAIALSLSLPLQAQPFDDPQARPFFAGLLPEGWMRHPMAQLSHRNDLKLFAYRGDECAGAVSFLEAGQDAPAPASHHEVQWLGDEEVAALLDALAQRPRPADAQAWRFADRLPVVFDGDRVGLPLGDTSSSHLLRPDLPGVERSVANAGFCMALAEVMGLRPAQTEIRSALGRPFVLTERYDRVVDASGRRQRLHQEDFCQALGVLPAMKYQHAGGPGLAECFDLLRRATRPVRPQILRLFDDVVFNALIGNHAAHARNFSLLYAGQETVLAPCDTLWSTAVYPALEPEMAMKIGSTYRFCEVQACDWEQFAQDAGFSWAQSRQRILELAQELPPAARRLRAMPGRGYCGNEVVERIIALIERRCASTVRHLSEANANAAGIHP